MTTCFLSENGNSSSLPQWQQQQQQRHASPSLTLGLIQMTGLVELVFVREGPMLVLQEEG